MADACGAAVSASSAPAGHADLGGSWRLDVGELRTPPLDSPRWHGLLGMAITPVAHTCNRSASEWRNTYAFAALRADGSVVTWGNANEGSVSSAVATRLDGTIGVTQVFSTTYAFAALRAVPWTTGDAPERRRAGVASPTVLPSRDGSYRRSMISSAMAVVPRPPPRSAVRAPPLMAASTACSMATASASSPNE